MSKRVSKGRTHIIIGDTQVKEGVPTAHLGWIGNYIVDQFKGQDVSIIHVGDHADMPSLSSYDKGKKAMEGRRYSVDIKAANDGWIKLCKPLEKYNAERRAKRLRPWFPKRYITLGNHENRITRAAEEDAQLEGTISVDDLNYAEWGWEVVPFLEELELDGISYSHYFYNPNTGRPYCGENLATRLKTIGRSFTMGHQQGLNMATRPVGKRRHQGLVVGSCLTPDHKVLTADLRYVPLGEVVAGDKLVSFDEFTPNENARRGRAFKTGTVLATKLDTAEVFLVTLSDGKEFKVTADHQWLTKCANGVGEIYSWRRTDSLRRGTRIAKPLDEWNEIKTHESGWLAGMYDGEGCYYERNTTRGRTGQLSIAQNEGPVLEKIREELRILCGVDGVSDGTDRNCQHLRIRGGIRKVAKVLGQIRPIRLLPKFKPEHLGQFNTTDANNPAVVSITPVGVQEIVRIDIDEKTMIVEGFAHHNCYLHDEQYLGPQGNNCWRGIVVCHQVENGSYDPMCVSLEFLCRKYENKTLTQYLRGLT